MRTDYKNLLAYLLIFTGVLMSMWMIWSLTRAYLAKDWPTTNALIYQVDIVHTISGLDKNYYKLNLKYRYKVRNIQFNNQQLYLTDLPFLSFEEADALREEYSPGTIHELRYDPKMPEQSALKTGVSNTIILLLAPTVLFLGIGFGARRKKPKKRHFHV